MDFEVNATSSTPDSSPGIKVAVAPAQQAQEMPAPQAVGNISSTKAQVGTKAVEKVAKKKKDPTVFTMRFPFPDFRIYEVQFPLDGSVTKPNEYDQLVMHDIILDISRNQPILFITSWVDKLEKQCEELGGWRRVPDALNYVLTAGRMLSEVKAQLVSIRWFMSYKNKGPYLQAPAESGFLYTAGAKIEAARWRLPPQNNPAQLK